MIVINAVINVCAVFFDGVINVLNFIWPILVAIILFGIIIFIHEFGHFFFAKLFKIKVNEFALGFGPKLFSKQGKETTYSLRALPIGGYCAMEGEDEESDDENAFHKKKIWKRIVVVVAGAMCNLILGFILVGATLLIDGGIGTTQVRGFAENSASQASGLEEGDVIYSVDGRRTYTSSDISYMLMSTKDPTVDMVVIRDGEKTNLEVTFNTTDYEGKNYISVDFSVLGEKISLTSFKAAGKTLKYTAVESVSMARIVWMSLFDLIAGRFGINEIMGPVGVVGTVSQAVSASVTEGLKNILYIMSLITINLGIVNLMPFPALDGGRIVLLAAQGITRKKIPAKYEAIIHATGFALLMVLIVVVSFNDILRLFK